MHWTRSFIHTLEKFLVPTPVQLVWSLGLSVAILLVTHVQLISSLLSSKAYVPQSDVSSVVTSYLVKLNHIDNVERIVNALFWAVVAFAAYVAYIIISNLFISTVNDYVVNTSFVNHKTGGTWGRIHGVIARIGWTAVLLFTLSLTFTVMVPTWLDWVSQPFTVPTASPLLILAAVFGLAVNIYLIWMLALAVFDADW